MPSQFRKFSAQKNIAGHNKNGKKTGKSTVVSILWIGLQMTSVIFRSIIRFNATIESQSQKKNSIELEPRTENVYNTFKKKQKKLTLKIENNVSRGNL